MSIICLNWPNSRTQFSLYWRKRSHSSPGCTCIIIHWPQWKHGSWSNFCQVNITHNTIESMPFSFFCLLSNELNWFACISNESQTNYNETDSQRYYWMISGGNATFPNILNNFVHICMYSYYMLSAMGPQYQKYLWWKKYMTELQIVSRFFPIISVFCFCFVSNISMTIHCCSTAAQQYTLHF